MEDILSGQTGLTATKDLTNKPDTDPAPIQPQNVVEMSATERILRQETVSRDIL